MLNLRTIAGIPPEEGCVYPSDESIREWDANLAGRVRHVRREFIFNVDKTGFSECTEAKDTHVIVPIEYDPLTIKVPVTRSSPRRSMDLCIVADGSSMKPFIIVERHAADEDMILI
jgi:hypothetical protein